MNLPLDSGTVTPNARLSGLAMFFSPTTLKWSPRSLFIRSRYFLTGSVPRFKLSMSVVLSFASFIGLHSTSEEANAI